MRITGHTPLWSAARALLAQRVDDFFGRWKKVLKGFDPEDIHDLRVSSRRLREGLALFAPVYPPGLSRAVRRVRRVTRLLGEMRNTDEALVFFRELSNEFVTVSVELGAENREPLAVIVARFEGLREGERQRLEAGLAGLDPAVMREFLAKTVASPLLFSKPLAEADPFEPVAAFAAESMEARLADVLALVPEARREENAEAQHALRIAVKHWRYRLEILSFLFREGYDEIRGVVKGYQECLGKLHDLDVFAAIVREEGLPSEVECVILNAIAARRGDHFARFAEMLAEHPPEGIGERVRTAL